MSDFIKFKNAMQKQFEVVIKDQEHLFLTDVPKDLLWETYLESYPEGTNEIYRENREYDCNSCRQFIRPFGNIVAIKDNELVSIWDIEELDHPFHIVASALSDLVKAAPIKNVFLAEHAKLGIDKNHQLMEDGTTRAWDHFFFKVPRKFVNKSGKSIESVQGKFRDVKNVFHRSMKEITIEAAQTILELIDQGSLYRGEESKDVIKAFIQYKLAYIPVTVELKDNWAWINSFNNPVAKIKNSAIGTLLVDITAELDLDEAVRKFEAIMAPTNYKRPKAIFTKKMIQAAEEKIVELGFSESLGRKYAVLEDITVNNVLFVNRDAKKKINGSVFDELKEDVPENVKNFDRVDEVTISQFINDILPNINSIELLAENKHLNNMMSLIAPQDREAPSMLKWNNNFSWAYNRDITDSMKQNVKNAGGNVEGVLMFSIQWNENGDNLNDFDAHCVEPSGNHIFFETKGRKHQSSGMLDVDIIQPRGVAVENITWTDKNRMQEGRYKFYVKNYSHCGGVTGFRAKIEYDGQIYSYDYPKELKQKEEVMVAEVEFTHQNGFKFLSSMDSKLSSREIWGVNTNKFAQVSVAMFSPNYWDGQKEIGNKHYFFFMEGCKNDSTPRGFFNEFLNNDLMEHKRVFEALGSKMRVEPSDNQLSGLGFSSTQRNSIVARVDGSFSRVIKINF
ncbi:hypothetical protein KAR91_69780 [Candidatus Pacearchaeota archaeon]|nr:hypothetical protein [Candidatus Pacearchaeota archaeon]